MFLQWWMTLSCAAEFAALSRLPRTAVWYKIMHRWEGHANCYKLLTLFAPNLSVLTLFHHRCGGRPAFFCS